MKIYFVRHAQSVYNSQNLLHHRHSGELSESGVKQAEFVAQRFQNIPLDLILSSPFERARQTSEIISKVIDKPIEYTDLLIEFQAPSELEGIPKADPKVMEIMKLLDEKRHDPEWKHSDEESFGELRDRAITLLSFLKSREENDVLCITHGLFMRIVLAVMMFGKNVSRDEFVRLMQFVRIANTGITLCTYNEDTDDWKLVTLNDQAHLG